MLNRKWALAVSLMLVLSLALGIGYKYFYYKFALSLQRPSIDYPTVVDLGERELGEVALVEFDIKNIGTSNLLIHEIKTTCSCTGLETKVGNDFLRVESLTFKAGEAKRMAVRVAVRGAPANSSFSNFVTFETNDPDNLNCNIQTIAPKVKGGVFPIPDIVSFGTVEASAEARFQIDLFDDAISPRVVDRIAVSNPKVISATLRTANELHDSPKIRPTKGTYIGQIEISVNTLKPGEVNEVVNVFVKDRGELPNPVRIVGVVSNRFEVTPKMLILPRNSSGGPVYKARCVCRYVKGGDFALSAQAPPGVTVSILPNTGAGDIPFEISLDPATLKCSVESELTIKLTAQAGTVNQDLLFTVLCKP